MEPDPPELLEQEAVFSPPKIPVSEILFQKVLKLHGESVECILFEHDGKIHVRMGNKEFRILGTTKADGTPIEFTPELVSAARQSCAVSSSPDGTIALSIKIPLFLTGDFAVEGQQVAASLASLHEGTHITPELFVVVRDGSIQIPFYGETTYRETLCQLRVEEVGVMRDFVARK